MWFLFWGFLIVALCVGNIYQEVYGWFVFGSGLILIGLLNYVKSKEGFYNED